MKRDIISDIVLLFSLIGLLFMFGNTPYLQYDAVVTRSISIYERMGSFFFIILMLFAIVVCAWKKKLFVMIGCACYGLLAYLPGIFLPGIEKSIAKGGTSLLDTFASLFWHRIYEVVNAPFAGQIGIVSEKTAAGMSKWFLPMTVITYIVVQLYRFYRDAYVAEQMHRSEMANLQHASLAKEIATPLRQQAAQPLGTIVTAPNGTTVATTDVPSADATYTKQEILSTEQTCITGENVILIPPSAPAADIIYGEAPKANAMPLENQVASAPITAPAAPPLVTPAPNPAVPTPMPSMATPPPTMPEGLRAPKLDFDDAIVFPTIIDDNGDDQTTIHTPLHPES